MKLNPILRFFREIIYNGLESFGKYYSTYRGFVANVDDPLNQSRLQLIIPEITGDQTYQYWAFSKNTFNGPGYGMQCLPKIGDLVWVEFERGNPTNPIWMHGHKGDEDAVDDAELNDKSSYWLKTPGGHLVKINDTKKTISVVTADGHNLVMDDSNNTIDLFHKGGQHIQISGGAISAVSDKAISLGTLTKSQYKAVLGEKAKDLLKDISKINSTFTTALAGDVAAPGAFLSKAAYASAVATMGPLAAGLEAKLALILSELVTLD